MACSCVGLACIIFSAVALVTSWVAFGVPLWSASGDADINTDDLKANADLSVGVWGVCTEVTISIEKPDVKEGFSADTCYLYYSPKQVRTFAREQADANSIDLDVEVKKESLCNIYKQTNASPPELLVSRKFLKDTCGPIGKATLAMASLASIFGTVMLVLLLLGITCCKKNGIFVILGAYLAVFSGLFQIISVGVWVRQSRDLNFNPPSAEPSDALEDIEADFKFNVSWGLAIIATILFWISASLAFKHSAKGDREDHEQRLSQAGAVGQPIVAGQGTNVGV